MNTTLILITIAIIEIQIFFLYKKIGELMEFFTELSQIVLDASKIQETVISRINGTGYES